MTLKNKFGGLNTLHRRMYQEWDTSDRCFVSDGKTHVPLDNHLGLIQGSSFTPLLNYLCTLFGVNEPYNPSARLLGEALGISISATGVQKSTERVGSHLDVDPEALIPVEEETLASELMVVSYDATGCPRISDEPEKEKGRKRLRNPTIAKMCTTVKVEKYHTRIPRITASSSMPPSDTQYVGACFGDDDFDSVREYIHRMAWCAGQAKARHLVVICDGQRSNWNIASDYFPEATHILDLYHAKEHLASFCRTLKAATPERLPSCYYEWERLLEQGEVTQLIGALKDCLHFGNQVQKSMGDKALQEIQYFETNKDRMNYDEYLKNGFPIGSGTIESACKQVVANRFKKQGMRWNQADSQFVLNGRLYDINGKLKHMFKPKPIPWSIEKTA